MKIWGIVRDALGLVTSRYAVDDLKQPNLTDRGNVAVEQILSSSGGPVPSTADTDDGTIAAGQTVAIGITENYVFSQLAGTWVRLNALPDNADAVPASTIDANVVIPHPQIYNGATWDRQRSVPDNADGQAALGLGTPGIISRLQGWNGATFDRITSTGNGTDNNPTTAAGNLRVSSHPKLFNETTFDRQRGNTDFTVLPSAVRIASVSSADFINYNSRGIILFYNITAAPGIQTLSVRIDNKDPVSGVYTATALFTATMVAAGIFSYLLYPSAITAAAYTGNIAGTLSRTFRITTIHSGVGGWTYSVGASLIL